MGKSLNKVMLIGRLGRDPELKYTSGGTPFCRFSIATDEQWKDKSSGEKQEKTEWHSIVAWDKLAEICNQYLFKGSQVYCEGQLQTREWDDKEGVKRKTTEVRLQDMTLLGSRPGGGGASGAPGAAGGQVPGSWDNRGGGAGGSGTGGAITDDDIPF